MPLAIEMLDRRDCPAILTPAISPLNEGHALNILNFSVSRTASDTGFASVQYQVVADATAPAANRATAGEDFVASSGTLLFGSNELSKSFPVRIIGDLKVEQDERFVVILSNPVGTVFSSPPGTKPPASVTVPIILRNDDSTLPVLSLVAASPAVREGDSASYTVRLSQPSSQTVTVAYATASGTAVAGADFDGISGTLEFAPGVTQRTLTVKTAIDKIAEPSETFSIGLRNPVNAMLDPQASGTKTTITNMLSAAVRAPAAKVKEGETAYFTIELAHPSTSPVSFAVTTANGSAVGGTDFTHIRPDGVIAVNVTNGGRNYTVPPAVEFQGGGGSGAQATAEVANGRVTKVIVTNPGSGYTSAPLVVFTDKMNGLFGAGGAAATASLQGLVTFAPGEVSKKVGVYAIPDTVTEQEEDFRLSIASVGGAGVVVDPAAAMATGVIAADSNAPPPAGPSGPLPPGMQRGSWTILVYMVGSADPKDAYYNKINERIAYDINQMEAAKTWLDPTVEIVVAWDQPSRAYTDATRAPIFATPGLAPPLGRGLSNTKDPWSLYGHSYPLTADTDMTKIVSRFNVLGEQDTGSPATLSSFLNWGKSVAPAEKYMLIVRGYGDPRYGMVVDFDNPNAPSGLTAVEVGQSLNSFSDGGRKIEVVAFDTNLSARVETAFEIANAASRSKPSAIVFSQEMIDRRGFDYGTPVDPDPTSPFAGNKRGVPPSPVCFEPLAAGSNPLDITAEDLARNLVRSYDARYGKLGGPTNRWDTLSAFNSHIQDGDGLNTAIAAFVNTCLTTATSLDYQAILSARTKTGTDGFQYGITYRGDGPKLPFYDLGRFAENLLAEGNLNEAIKVAARTLLDVMVSHRFDRVTDTRNISSGLSLYMPSRLDDPYLSVDKFRGLHGQFCNATQWDKFVRWLVEGTV